MLPVDCSGYVLLLVYNYYSKSDLGDMIQERFLSWHEIHCLCEILPPNHQNHCQQVVHLSKRCVDIIFGQE